MKKLFFEISLESCHEIPLEISILNSTLIIHYKVSLNFLKVPLENYYFKFHKSFNRKLNIKFPIRNFHPRNWFCKMKRWIWKKHSIFEITKKIQQKIHSFADRFFVVFFVLQNHITLSWLLLCFALHYIALHCIALHCIRWFSIWNDLMNKIFYFIFYSFLFFFLLNFVYLLVHKFFRISFLDFLCFEREWIS